MKNIFCLLALSFTFLFQVKAQTTIDKIIATRHDEFENNAWKGKDSSIISYNNDGFLIGNLNSKNDANSVWNNFTKVTITLSPTNKKTSELRENWNGISWINQSRYTKTYDGSDNLILDFYEVWNGTTWNQTGKIEYTGYNSFGKYGQENLFNMVSGNWKNLSQRTRTYYAVDSNLEIDNRFNWDNTTSSWKKIERFTYTYVQDSVGSITRSIPDSNSNWMNDSKTIRTYAFNPQRMTEYKVQIWDTAATPDVWVNTNRTLYFYTNTYNIDYTSGEIATSATTWTPQYKTFNTYNSSDNLIEMYDQWLINGSWENYSRKTSSYIGNNIDEEKYFSGNGSNWNETKKINFLYDVKNNKTFQQIDSFKNGSFVQDSRDYFYYATFPLAVQQVLKSINEVVIYPNPATESVNITFNAINNFNAQISISDITGKTRMLIFQPINKGENKINTTISTLESGTYILSILDNKGKAYHQKIQIIK